MRAVVFLSIFLLVWPSTSLTPVARAAQAAATSKPTQTQPAAKTPAQTSATDKGWPRTYELKTGLAVLYQPQVEAWIDQKRMTAWSAVSYTKSGEKQPALGTIKIEANTKVAVDERMVNFSDLAITEIRFSTLEADAAKSLVAQLTEAMPTTERVISLDRVLAAIDVSKLTPKNVPGAKADPPTIFSSTTAAILVNVDGEPVWSPIKENDLKYVVNTNWDLFQHQEAGTYYLRHETHWLKSGSLNGAWEPAGTLPESFKKLPNDDNWKDVRGNLPGKAYAKDTLPRVFYSQTPAELVLVKGAPVYEPVKGTSLLWVNNTESDLFRNGKDGPFYYLVSGRWFESPGLQGPWAFATPNLPPDFKKIPLEHPRSRVLAAVPGTDQANEAVLLASIPKTARVNKKELKAPEVKYDGEPKYEAIQGTKVERAVNTDKDIIKFGDLYYMCFQAVWFVSKGPEGPWTVAESIPKEIYEIPASSPAHNVTYVVIEDDDDDNDEWVNFAYFAGYTGAMIAWGCVVWGSGWYYPPYVGFYGGYYPRYYGYPMSYGMSAWYNPWTGAYGRGYGAYGPYGGAGVGAAYNPRTGTYARGAAAYGPYGGRATAQAYNPRTGTYASTRQGSNVYGNWGSSTVQRGDNWVQTGHSQNYRTGNTNTGMRTSEGGGALSHTGQAGRTTVGRTGSGDVYAGHDGNVYRNNGGTWEKWDNGGWNDTGRDPANRPQPRTEGTDRTGQVDRSSGTTQQLDRDRSARESGTQRSSSAGSYRSSPSMGSAGTYRGGGGGSRGGGGRRR